MTETAADKIRTLISGAQIASKLADEGDDEIPLTYLGYINGLEVALIIVESTPDPLLEQMAEALRLAREAIDVAEETYIASVSFYATTAREISAKIDAALSAYESRKS